MLPHLWQSRDGDIVAAHERAMEAIAAGDIEAACANIRKGR